MILSMVLSSVYRPQFKYCLEFFNDRIQTLYVFSVIIFICSFPAASHYHLISLPTVDVDRFLQNLALNTCVLKNCCTEPSYSHKM